MKTKNQFPATDAILKGLVLTIVFTVLPTIISANFNASQTLSDVTYKIPSFINTINEPDVEATMELVYEQEIFMEDWMLNPNHEFWKLTFEESNEEQEIDLENWMLDLSEWNLEDKKQDKCSI